MEADHDDDWYAVRRRAQSGIGTGVLWRILCEIAIRSQDIGGHGPRPYEQAGKHLRADLVKLIVKRRHHAEVTTRATNGPEQVLVLFRAGRPQLTVRGHDVNRE